MPADARTADAHSGAGSATEALRDWPDWRGPDRDGHVAKLPSKLPDTVKVIWKKSASAGGLAPKPGRFGVHRVQWRASGRCFLQVASAPSTLP